MAKKAIKSEKLTPFGVSTQFWAYHHFKALFQCL